MNVCHGKRRPRAEKGRKSRSCDVHVVVSSINNALETNDKRPKENENQRCDSRNQRVATPDSTP